MARKPETQLVKAAMQFLTLRGWHPIRVNAGLTILGNGRNTRAIRGAAPGTADIIACSERGSFAAFEAKVKPNKPTEAQLAFLEEVRRRGGIAGVFHDLDELDELMRSAE